MEIKLFDPRRERSQRCFGRGDLMAVQSRNGTTDSMPERIQVTQDLERRYKEQEAAKQAAKTKTPSSLKTHTSRQEQR
jgi:hypothetical protein